MLAVTPYQPSNEGQILLLTKDGGTTWNQQSLPPGEWTLDDLFADSASYSLWLGATVAEEVEVESHERDIISRPRKNPVLLTYFKNRLGRDCGRFLVSLVGDHTDPDQSSVPFLSRYSGYRGTTRFNLLV